MIKYLEKIKSLVGYSFFLCFVLEIVTPLTAYAAFGCKLAPGSHPVFDSSGRVIDRTGSSRWVQFLRSNVYQQNTNGYVMLEETYTINVQGQPHTVYQLSGSGAYIDTSSFSDTSGFSHECFATSPPPPINDRKRRNNDRKPKNNNQQPKKNDQQPRN